MRSHGSPSLGVLEPSLGLEASCEISGVARGAVLSQHAGGSHAETTTTSQASQNIEELKANLEFYLRFIRSLCDTAAGLQAH